MKICMSLRREAHLQVKRLKAPHVRTPFRPLLEVDMSKNCRPLLRQADFQVKMFKTPHAWGTFEGSDVVLRGRRKGLCTLSKVSQKRRGGFCSNFNYNHYTTRHYSTLQLQQLQLQLQLLQLQLQLRNFSRHYTRPTLHFTILHYMTLHSLHHLTCNCNYTTLVTLHHN